MTGHIHNLKGRRYVPDRPVKIEHRHASPFGEAYWKVRVNDKLWHVGRTQGKRVRIAFKPRGQNIGYWWTGVVRDDAGREVYSARVGKSTGPLALLHDAGLLNWQWEVDAIEQNEQALRDADTASVEELEAASDILDRLHERDDASEKMERSNDRLEGGGWEEA